MKQHPQHSVGLVLRVLGIASSTFYGWMKQSEKPSQQRLDDEQLLAEIVDIHTSSGGTYGSPRVHAMLRRRGIPVGRKRVERLMRRAGLQGAFLRKKWRIGSTRQDRPDESAVSPSHGRRSPAVGLVVGSCPGQGTQNMGN
ncbi:IS3 family transposase [Nocardia nepalensis]|uniref:IS3 family transposase n=1 Tax=Nocardia nepalensis TaxID=3375448 RepID=UPI003B671F4F